MSCRPEAVLGYARCYLKPTVDDFEEWHRLLAMLLARLETIREVSDASGFGGTAQATASVLLQAYEDTLEYVAAFMRMSAVYSLFQCVPFIAYHGFWDAAPDYFVQLLPEDGAMDFYLEYIQLACRSHSALMLRQVVLFSWFLYPFLVSHS